LDNFFIRYNLCHLRFFYDEGDFFSVLMIGGLTYYFFLEGTGRLLEEDDPFVQ
tara:strand:+ start:384 stop:542 length:159 start_codon:yes stop_codon:yes gene_type:complete